MSAIQKQFVKVVITASRPEVTRNHAWGMTADITNISSQPMTLFAREVQLIIQPEATRGDDTVTSPSLLPYTGCSSEPNDVGSKSTCGTVSGSESDSQVVLQPGEHYPFFFSASDAVNDKTLGNCYLWNFCYWEKFQETLNFVPGPYAFVVSGKIHLDDAKDTYHTFAESVSVKISLPQELAMICFGPDRRYFGARSLTSDAGRDWSHQVECRTMGILERLGKSGKGYDIRLSHRIDSFHRSQPTFRHTISSESVSQRCLGSNHGRFYFLLCRKQNYRQAQVARAGPGPTDRSSTRCGPTRWRSARCRSTDRTSTWCNSTRCCSTRWRSARSRSIERRGGESVSICVMRIL